MLFSLRISNGSKDSSAKTLEGCSLAKKNPLDFSSGFFLESPFACGLLRDGARGRPKDAGAGRGRPDSKEASSGTIIF
jgi:hypothetical protein